MKLLLLIICWCLLLVLCWPLALAVLVLLPVVWLLLLPFRLGWMAIEAVLALVRAILFLPARILSPRR